MVELVGAHPGLGGRQLYLAKAAFLVERIVAAAHMHALFGELELRGDQFETAQRHIDDSTGIHCIGERNQRRPGAGKTAHRPAMNAIVEDVLDRSGVEHRNFCVPHRIFRLRGQRRGFAGVIVAADGEDTAET